MKTRDQIRGAAVIVMITAALCFFRMMAPVVFSGPTDGRPPYSDRKSGSLIVELAGQTEHRGVYFIPEGSSVSDFVRMVGIGTETSQGGTNLNGRLKSPSVVTIWRDDHEGVSSVTVNRMSGAKRFALGLPMDLNSVTADELDLVPGIGEKTATRIIEYRQEAGRFRKISELQGVKGIKNRKFAALHRYFTVE